jgi:anti-sigma factor RsiW
MTNPACERWHLLLQADHDGELTASEATDLMVHLAGCAACRAERDSLAALSEGLRALPRHAAPAALRAALTRQAAMPPAAAPSRPRRAWAGGALALAACIAAVMLLPRAPDPDGAAIASHIRALQPGHLTDVLSSDQHTVKPWFNGRLDYAPPVRDFASAGYPLLGGRLDYLAGRDVAALVYGRDRHIIDLFVWPSDQSGSAEHVASGYNTVAWNGGGMRFVAVSDLNMAELRVFAALWGDAGR